MTHIDEETLAIVALDDAAALPAQREHLSSCPTCSADLDELRRTVALGRSSRGVDLDRPGPEVWGRIRDELGFEPVATTPVAAETAGVAELPAAPERAAAPELPAAPERAAALRPRRRSLRLALWLPITAAAAVLGVLGGIAGSGLLRDAVGTPGQKVVSEARLEALPGWPGAKGTATLERARDGALTLVVDMRPGTGTAPAGEPLREVWLMRSDLSGLVSVGLMDGTHGTFTVPVGVDVRRFPLVDVSAEPDDGDPTHSGASIMRGTLSSPVPS
ncbi:hypothetical protein AS850_12305 [Frondihabitans sp. 762G35]|uniref:anti-sigma factor n=1 Tax=Frondihabitans sp. 762G35 TaxID=1446794 RepID=UPI000D1FDB82|nr:anti-sigma factor [Frondihabitans sp. 762G35]ARC57857.1 hypothetical protein AS850_12305 [Frondihabitans sp. 762G35]